MPVVLVVGDEELLVERAVRAAVDEATAAEPAAEVRRLEAAAVVAGELAERLGPSLFSDTQVLVLTGAQDLAKELAAELVVAAGGAPPEVHLVVVHAGGVKGKALLTALAELATRRVDVPRVTKAGERRDFVRAELRSGGRRVEEEAVTALVDAVGTDLRELASTASQLLADTDGPVTVELVQRYHRGKAEASGFAVADRAVEGDVAGALELVRWGASTGLAPVLVTSALGSTLRAMAQVGDAGRGTSAFALAKQLGMPAWKVEKTQRQVRGWRPDGLARAVRAVADADAAVKGGAADAQYAVERLVLAVVAARQ